MALSKGRYRWPHDKVLGVLATIVSRNLKQMIYEPNKKKMDFVRDGEKVKTSQKQKTSLLSSAPDWQLRVDIGKQLNFLWK